MCSKDNTSLFGAKTGNFCIAVRYVSKGPFDVNSLPLGSHSICPLFTKQAMPGYKILPEAAFTLACVVLPQFTWCFAVIPGDVVASTRAREPCRYEKTIERAEGDGQLSLK